jgi:hypothetical protein
MLGSRWPALVVVLVCLVVLIAPWGGGVVRPAADPPTVPDHIEGFSWRNAEATDSPPGRAIALYADRFDEDFYPTRREIVVGASGETYRWVPDHDVYWGPLSPDGTMIAGSGRGAEAEKLALLDLVSGHVEQRQVRGVPVEWFPDGRRLAYRAHPPGPGFHDQLGVLDLSTGQTSMVPIDLDTALGAFGRLAISPDGTELATQFDGVIHSPDQPTDLTDPTPVGPVRIYGMDGTLRRSLDIGQRSLQLSQPWSPDGRLIAVQDKGSARSLTFVDATGHGMPAPSPVTAQRVSGDPHDIDAGLSIVGWSATDRVVVNLFTSGRGLIFDVPLGGGQSRRLSSLSADDPYPFTMATGLLPRLRVYETGWFADRGHWSLWQRIVASLLVGMIAAAAIVLLRRIRRRVNARDNAAPPPGG